MYVGSMTFLALEEKPHLTSMQPVSRCSPPPPSVAQEQLPLQVDARFNNVYLHK